MENQDQNFDTFKKTFIEWCKSNGACEGEFRKVVASKDAKELLAVIHANFHWCMGISFDANSLKVFGNEALFAAKIIVGDLTGKRLEEGVWCVAQSTVEAYGSSTVNAYGSSTVEAWDWAILHIRKNGHKLELGSNWKIEDVTILASGETK